MDKKNKVEKETKKVEKKIKKEVKKETKKVAKKTVKKVPKTELKKEPKKVEPKKIEPRKVILSKEKVDDYFSHGPFLENIEKIKEKKQKKVLNRLQLIVIVIFSVIMLVLLCNRTFFRNKYKNSKINLDIPLLMFFKSDDGNKLVLKTLRKSAYVTEFFEDKLDNMTKYNCNGYSFYYDEDNYYAIYNIKVEKDFIVKTVTINYAGGEANCLCNAGVTGKEAEEICKR